MLLNCLNSVTAYMNPYNFNHLQAFAMISAVINSTNTSLELEHVLLDGGNSSRNISSLVSAH